MAGSAPIGASGAPICTASSTRRVSPGFLVRDHLRAWRRAGPAAPARSFRDFQEAQLDRLADLLRTHLDLARIRALIQP